MKYRPFNIVPTTLVLWVSFSPIPVHQQLKGRNSPISTPPVSQTPGYRHWTPGNQYFPLAKLQNPKIMFNSIAIREPDLQTRIVKSQYSQKMSKNVS